MKSGLNSALQQRLRFMDLLLDRYGYFTRDVLADYWGLSVPQISLDIRAFMDVTGDMAFYNKSSRRYERSEDFKRTWP